MHYGFRVIRDLKSGLMHYLEEQGFTSPSDIVGKALSHIKSQEELKNPETHSQIDTERCIGCGLCYIACRDGGHTAIKWNEDERRPKVDEDKCTGCAMCMQVCPVSVIKMEEKLNSEIYYYTEER
jgi:dihydropyrimidine dehydrogenase (NAD+) subunit PreA